VTHGVQPVIPSPSEHPKFEKNSWRETEQKVAVGTRQSEGVASESESKLEVVASLRSAECFVGWFESGVVAGQQK